MDENALHNRLAEFVLGTIDGDAEKGDFEVELSMLGVVHFVKISPIDDKVAFSIDLTGLRKLFDSVNYIKMFNHQVCAPGKSRMVTYCRAAGTLMGETFLVDVFTSPLAE